jgi:hypothetical protein
MLRRQLLKRAGLALTSAALATGNTEAAEQPAAAVLPWMNEQGAPVPDLSEVAGLVATPFRDD